MRFASEDDVMWMIEILPEIYFALWNRVFQPYSAIDRNKINQKFLESKECNIRIIEISLDTCDLYQAVISNPVNIIYIDKPPFELQLFAVSKNKDLLFYVDDFLKVSKLLKLKNFSFQNGCVCNLQRYHTYLDKYQETESHGNCTVLENEKHTPDPFFYRHGREQLLIQLKKIIHEETKNFYRG